MEERTKCIIGVPIICILFLLMACTTATEPQPEIQEPVTLKIVQLPFLSFAPYFIALEEDYFAEQNIEIEFVQFDDNADAIPALAQGQLDVGAGFISPGFFTAVANDGNLRIVADKGHTDNPECVDNVFMIQAESRESGLVAGMTISSDPLSIDGYVLERYLSGTELTLDDFTFNDVPPPLEIEAMNSGEVDVVAASEPWITRLQDETDSETLIAWDDIYPDIQYATILYGDRLLNEDREVGVRFMTAYLRAVRQYNEGKTDRNLDILSEATELDRDLLERLCWPAIRETGEVNMESILSYQEWNLENGYIEKTVSEDQIYDSSFVEEAQQILAVE